MSRPSRTTPALALLCAVCLLPLLLPTMAEATDPSWVTWYCPVVVNGDTCDSIGKAYYKCDNPGCGATFSRPAEVDETGQWVAPPLMVCQVCQASFASPQWAECHRDPADSTNCHWFYPLSWCSYYGGRWWDYNYYRP